MKIPICKIGKYLSTPTYYLLVHTQHAGIDYKVKHIKHFINISFSLYFCHTLVVKVRLSQRTGVDDTLNSCTP